MTSIRFADVEITVTDGHLSSTSVIVNGMDLSRFTNKVEFAVSGDEPLAIVKLTLLANVKIKGEFAIETEALEGKVFNIG